MNNQEWDWKLEAILTEIVSLIQYIRDHPIPNRKLEVFCHFGHCEFGGLLYPISATHRYAYIIAYRNQKNPEICSLFSVICSLKNAPQGVFLQSIYNLQYAHWNIINLYTFLFHCVAVTHCDGAIFHCLVVNRYAYWCTDFVMTTIVFTNVA